MPEIDEFQLLVLEIKHEDNKELKNQTFSMHEKSIDTRRNDSNFKPHAMLFHCSIEMVMIGMYFSALRD